MRGAALRPLRCEKHRHNFSSLDELEKSPARGHVMSLTMRVKLTDCFLLLCPRTLLLPHSSHVSLSLSRVPNISIYFPHPPRPRPRVYAPRDTAAGRISRPARRMYTTCSQGDVFTHSPTMHVHKTWTRVDLGFPRGLNPGDTHTRSRDHSIAFQAQLRMTYI